MKVAFVGENLENAEKEQVCLAGRGVTYLVVPGL
jgi:hypothetical protein